jgi:hypothetical protein
MLYVDLLKDSLGASIWLEVPEEWKWITNIEKTTLYRLEQKTSKLTVQAQRSSVSSINQMPIKCTYIMDIYGQFLSGPRETLHFKQTSTSFHTNIQDKMFNSKYKSNDEQLNWFWLTERCI